MVPSFFHCSLLLFPYLNGDKYANSGEKYIIRQIEHEKENEVEMRWRKRRRDYRKGDFESKRVEKKRLQGQADIYFFFQFFCATVVTDEIIV